MEEQVHFPIQAALRLHPLAVSASSPVTGGTIRERWALFIEAGLSVKCGEDGSVVLRWLIVVYDNNAHAGAWGHDAALHTAWGFACWIETPEGTVLFDTGGDGPTLLGNLARMGLDPQVIDAVVLSHAHGDHTDGLAGLLDTGVRPMVYVPVAFPASFKENVGARTDLVEVTGPIEIIPGVYTTGQVGSSIVEQALVVETGEGLVVVTGCAHPGVVEMVRRAREALPSPHPFDRLRAGSSPYQGEGVVALVMGGFHLKDTDQAQIEAIIADLRNLGVQRVAPCHCTGDQARRTFAEAFGAEFFPAGAGWTITFR